MDVRRGDWFFGCVDVVRGCRVLLELMEFEMIGENEVRCVGDCEVMCSDVGVMKIGKLCE